MNGIDGRRWSIQPRNVSTVLPMNLFIVELAEEKRSVEVKPRHPKLAIPVPARHVSILNADDLRDKPTEHLCQLMSLGIRRRSCC